jgi:hypothetical protein
MIAQAPAARAAALVAALGALAGGAGRGALARPKVSAVEPCGSDAGATGPGSLDPFRPPAPRAVELNAAGLVPYRQGKWEEARAQYRAALAADSEFLAPRLNIASSFVRQERFAEATAEVVALLDLAYVPWAREVREAADLGALKARPEGKEIERAMAASASKWGEGLDASELFVARLRPPLHVPDGAGTFILNPRQEVWAYAPRTRRYRQLTAEDGHVVALARSADRRRILYVTAEKLVRGARPDDVALRGVAIHELTLATMVASPPARVPGDVRRLEIFSNLYVSIPDGKRRRVFRSDGAGTLVPVGGFAGGLGDPTVLLTGEGVELEPKDRTAGHCPLPELALKASHGAGRAGLPIP